MYFYVLEIASFLKPHEPTSASFQLISCSFLTSLLAFTELKRVRALLWIRLWHNRVLWLVWSFIQTMKTLSLSAIRLFCFLICMFTGVLFLISFKNSSFAFVTSLTVWPKRPSYWLILAFDMPSSLSLVISSFWIKVRDVRLFLSLKHLEAIVRLWTGLISLIQCLRQLGGQGGREREKWRNVWSVEQSEHTYLLSLRSYMGMVHGALK